MPRNQEIKKVLVIGSGPIVIGQAAEFDYAGTQACRSLKEEGVEDVYKRQFDDNDQMCAVGAIDAAGAVTLLYAGLNFQHRGLEAEVLREMEEFATVGRSIAREEIKIPGKWMQYTATAGAPEQSSVTEQQTAPGQQSSVTGQQTVPGQPSVTGQQTAPEPQAYRNQNTG